MQKARLEPEEMHFAIMRAAIDIASQGDWHDVTARRVADEIGYTAPIIYQYFKSKKAMLRSIVEQGYEELGDVIREAAEKESESSARFWAIGDAYFRFAKQNFHVYQLMHDSSLYKEPGEAKVKGTELFRFMCEEITRLAGRKVSREEAVDRTFQAWATMHGLIMIEANCSFEPGLLKPEKVIEQFGRDFIAALESK